MLNNTKAYKAYECMGSILARLAFNTAFKNLPFGADTKEEQDYLQHALQDSVSALIGAQQYYDLDDEAVEACAEGFALALARMFLDARVGHMRRWQTKTNDGQKWELVFDPGPMTDDLRTDEDGRVWRKAAADPLDFLP